MRNLQEMVHKECFLNTKTVTEKGFKQSQITINLSKYIFSVKNKESNSVNFPLGK